MKLLPWLFVISALILLSCTYSPIEPIENEATGGANVTIQFGAIGTLAKSAKTFNMSNSKMIVSLSATGQTTINDTFVLSSNMSTIVNKSYTNLASLIN
jgi:hypothetical protein